MEAVGISFSGTGIIEAKSFSEALKSSGKQSRGKSPMSGSTEKITPRRQNSNNRPGFKKSSTRAFDRNISPEGKGKFEAGGPPLVGILEDDESLLCE